VKYEVEYGLQTVPWTDADGNPLEGHAVTKIVVTVDAPSEEMALSLSRPAVVGQEFINADVATDVRKV
jgi:hypothetical protein